MMKAGRSSVRLFLCPNSASAAAHQAEDIGDACRYRERHDRFFAHLVAHPFRHQRSLVGDRGFCSLPQRQHTFRQPGEIVAKGCDLRRQIICCDVRLDARGGGFGGSGFQFCHGLLLFHGMPLQRDGGPKGSAGADLLFAAKALSASGRPEQLFA